MDRILGYLLQVIQYDEMGDSDVVLGYLGPDRSSDSLRVYSDSKRAKLYDTVAQAIDAASTYMPHLQSRGDIEVETRAVLTPEWEKIRRYQLREEGAERFGLSKNTPYSVLADRYEDEGESDKAAILRSQRRVR